mmetsp:Transcript_25809/g.62208  ORF Transcript_25809/g.62208 Transcript_25809/m.62208 type:complete len:224 (-) Transcript_25809:693-1364(-)
MVAQARQLCELPRHPRKRRQAEAPRGPQGGAQDHEGGPGADARGGDEAVRGQPGERPGAEGQDAKGLHRRGDRHLCLQHSAGPSLHAHGRQGGAPQRQDVKRALRRGREAVPRGPELAAHGPVLEGLPHEADLHAQLREEKGKHVPLHDVLQPRGAGDGGDERQGRHVGAGVHHHGAGDAQARLGQGPGEQLRAEPGGGCAGGGRGRDQARGPGGAGAAAARA